MKFWFKSGAWSRKRAQEWVATIRPEDVRRVAVIRHAAVGDMVLTRPFLLELRRLFPNAQLTLSLCSNYTRGAPEDLVDRVHVVYGSDQRQMSLKAQIARARELGEQDIVFDLAATARSFWLCKLTKAKLKVGFPYHEIQRHFFYDVTIPRSDLRFEAENMLEMLSVFGHCCQHPPRFEMPGEPAQRATPYILYFPSASTREKCWPDDRFADLIKRMAERYPTYEHIVLEGIAEWESIAKIMAPLAAFSNVTGMKLDEFSATVSLTKSANLLISNDTGIRNLAIACETPTVGIFFVTPVFRYWPRYGGHEVVFNPDGSVPAVEHVYSAAQKILAG